MQLTRRLEGSSKKYPFRGAVSKIGRVGFSWPLPSLLSRQSPEIYRHVMKVLARRLRDTNYAQLVGQFTDIVFDVAAGGGN
jgi:CRP-like cAMP-binding protein